MGGKQRIFTANVEQPPRWTISQFGMAMVGILWCVLASVAIAVASGVLYHVAVYGNIGNVGHFANVGLLLGVLYTQPWLRLREFDAQLLGTQHVGLRRIVWQWTAAFACLGLAAFLLKMTADFSRGWVLVLFVLGLPALWAAEVAFRSFIRTSINASWLEPKRIMLLGSDAVVRQLALEAQQDEFMGTRIIGAIGIDTDLISVGLPQCAAELDAILERAVATARTNGATDVVLLSDWSNTAYLDMCADAFAVLPVALHIEAKGVVGRCSGVKTQQLHGLKTVVVVPLPLAQTETAAKRLFDVVVAGAALVALAPVFLALAALIKLDSSGPAFFQQRRVGYNQREFRIWKFRSMTTMDDGDTIVQAKKHDPRVTRVGAWLRRYNLDELPQLINVLRGEMSIVGPRPHAVAHDKLFEQSVDMYPRRLNVKPGITGWAQINGFRGETDTEAKMHGRVAHDLYYVDNWSLGLDLYIIAMTVVSPKTYRNAY